MTDIDALRQVWCVVYDSDTPFMDGTHPPLRMADQSLEQAERNLEVMQSRPARAPKRNLRIETRFVSEWTRVTPPGVVASMTEQTERLHLLRDAMLRAADELDAIDSLPHARLGGVSLGGLIRYEVAALVEVPGMERWLNCTCGDPDDHRACCDALTEVRHNHDPIGVYANCPACRTVFPSGVGAS